MPEFTYIARVPSGQQTTGTMSANSEREVMNLLDQRGLFPVRIEPARPAASVGLFSRKIKSRYLATLFAQMADLLHSGVPLMKALEILERQSSVPAMSEILRDVRARVADGSTLADAMARHPRAFNELNVSMIRAGEEGGFLEDVLRRIADFTDHQEDLKSKVVGALAYPVFLAIIGSAIVFGLVIFLVPKFKDMFAQQEKEGSLPWLTKALLATSGFILGNWWILLGLLIGLWIAFRFWKSTPDGRQTVDRWKLAMPGAGNIYRNLAIARFCRILGTLRHNGIELIRALQIAKDSTGNKILTDAIEEAAKSVKDGQSLAAPLAASGHFPSDIVEMITVGEESNSLETVLLGIADTTERRTTRQLELFVRLLEPVMLLVMAGITLVVVLALLLPFLNQGKMVGT